MFDYEHKIERQEIVPKILIFQKSVHRGADHVVVCEYTS